MRAKNATGLWKNSGFHKYYMFNVLTYFGAGISTVALPYAIFQTTVSPFHTSLVAVGASLPYLLFGLPAGAIADRGNRKRIMIGSDLFCGLVLATVPVAAMLGDLAALHLIIVSLLASTAFVAFDSASHGALLQLVGRENLVAANSALITADTVIRLGSPVVAGIVISGFGAEWAIGVTACCYLLSAALIRSIRQPFQAPARARAEAAERTDPMRRLRADIREGLSYIWSEPLVRSLTLIGFGNGFVAGAVTGLLVVFGSEALGFADNASQLSVLYTCGSVGALCASLLLPGLRRRFKPGRITIAGLVCSGGALLGFAQSGAMPAASLFYLLWSAANTLIIINGITLRQQITPDHLQGRVHATGRMIAYGGTPFGALVGGAATAWYGSVSAYTALAVVMLALFVIALGTPLRHYVLPGGKAAK